MLTFHNRILFRSSALGTHHRFLVSTNAAKDKKGSKKGVSALAGLMKKKAEAEEAQSLQPKERATPVQFRDPEVRGLLFSLATSYFKATKKFLVRRELCSDTMLPCLTIHVDNLMYVSICAPVFSCSIVSFIPMSL